LAHLRNFGFGEELDGGGFVGGDDGFGGVPVEVREVGVGGILGVGQQAGEHFGALGYRGAGQGAGEVHPHDGGFVFAGHSRKFTARGGAWLLVFAQQLNGPAAQHRFAVLQQFEQVGLGQAVDAVQAPQGAQAQGGGFAFSSCCELGFQDGIDNGEGVVAGFLPGGGVLFCVG